MTKRSLKYRKFKHKLIADLRSGLLKPGDLLPTVVQMSDIHGIAPNTVRRALIELDDEGVIRRVRGKGIYICEGAHQQMPRRLDALGLIVNEAIAKPYPALVHGLEATAEQMCSQIILSNSQDDPIRQGNIILQMIDKRVAGVVMVPTIPLSPPSHIRLLQENDIPVVCCHRRVDGARTPLVALPFKQISYRAGQILIEHGHRNIALMLPVANIISTPQYIEGLREALTPSGGMFQEVYFEGHGKNRLDHASREQDVSERIGALMAKPNHPTAIMSCFDPDAEMVYMILTKMGLKIPEDVSLITFGGKVRKGAIVSRLTAVTVDGAETGRLAGKLIKEMIDGDRAIDDTEEFTLNVEIHHGETLKTLP